MALLQKAYLGATPLFRNEDWFEDQYTLVNDSGDITVTANTAAHTKGAWSELVASTAANASLLVLNVSNISAASTNTATLVDIASGASGSESAIISNVAVGGALTVTTSGPTAIAFSVPIKIASGTRVSARIQSVVTGGKTATVRAFLYDVGDYSTAPTTVDVIGGNTANSEGISFSGASGTWVQATGSTSQKYRAVVAVGSTHNATIANGPIAISIGVGASGSEVTFGQTEFRYISSEATLSTPPYLSLFGREIPAGSRLAVKHNLGVNPDRYGFCLIGIP